MFVLPETISDEFLDWLNECPYGWTLLKCYDDGYIEYGFYNPISED